MITLVKSFVDDNKVQKKINIKKIISMKQIINKPIDEVNIRLKNLDNIDKISKFSLEDGKTKIKIDVDIDKKTLSFRLKENRKIDHKMLNLLRKDKNIEIN